MTPTDDEIRALLEVEENVTGPRWVADGAGVFIDEEYLWSAGPTTVASATSYCGAKLIALARNNLRSLCEEVLRLRAENEKLIWNLAGISTIACAEAVDDYVRGSDWERAALGDVCRLVDKMAALRAENERLRNLRCACCGEKPLLLPNIEDDGA